MKTYYQLSNDTFSIAGVHAVAMTEEQFNLLKTKVDFLAETSNEVIGYKAAITKQQAEVNAKAKAAYENREITMRQGRLQLLKQGLLAQVEKAIEAMPEPDKSAAKIEWEYSNTLKRNNLFVKQLGAALGLTEMQVDGLFDSAALL